MEKSTVFCEGRTIYLSGMVDSKSIGEVNADLLKLLDEDDTNEKEKVGYERKPIKLYISSNGGSLWDAWGLIDIILTSKTPIWTYCTGYALSAGITIFIAGHKRFVFKHASLMYHQLSSGTYGKFQSIKESAEQLQLEQAEIENYMIERSNITKDRLEEVREKKIDWWITPKEAVALEMADEII